MVDLWTTGVGLSYQIYGETDLGWAFKMKMLSFTGLLAVVVFVNYYMLAMAKKGRAPDPTSIYALPMHA